MATSKNSVFGKYASGNPVIARVYSEVEMKARWDKKKDRVKILAQNIRSLRYNITRDLKSDEEKTFLTAAALLTMLETAERVGNSESANKGHRGVTGLLKSQVTITGNKIEFNYTAKSGVEQDKTITDARLADALSKAKKMSSSAFLFCTSWGFCIKADRVNRYLSDFDVTAKDIRGYSANRWLVDRLKSKDVPKEEKERKTEFIRLSKLVASKVGHSAQMLRKSYLIPELEPQYIEKGKIVDINDATAYEEGGEVTRKVPKDFDTDFDFTWGDKNKKDGTIIVAHSTSSNLLPEIYKHGLKANSKKTWEDSSRGKLFFELEPTSTYRMENVYGWKSVQAHGGVNVTLYVRVPQNKLSVDRDDKVLGAGYRKNQRECSCDIPPKDILGARFLSIDIKPSDFVEFSKMFDDSSEYKEGGETKKPIANTVSASKANPNHDGGNINKVPASKAGLIHVDDKDSENMYKKGGILDESKKETYQKWKKLVNMPSSEIEKFLQSEEGLHAGLSSAEAHKLGIHNGRQSARWIIKMKHTPVTEWTPTMWDWCRRQISFISRMRGNKGGLYDEKGNKTRKHTALLIWGHNPKKFEEGGEVKLLAPNGKPSNLTPEQYKLVRTPEFIKYFGDWIKTPKKASKIVDANGEPLVVYHGSMNNFDVFNLDKIGSQGTSEGHGFYFTADKGIASGYAEKRGKGRLFEVFLNIRNPYSNDKRTFTKYDIRKILAELHRRDPEFALSNFGDIEYEGLNKVLNEATEMTAELETDTDVIGSLVNGGIGSVEDILDVVKKVTGKDGVITKWSYDENRSPIPIYVAIDPTQIKLADGTNTTFDSKNPDVRFESGGVVADSPAFKKWFAGSKVVDKHGNPLVVYHGTPDARALKVDYIFKTRDEIFSDILNKQNDDSAYFFTDSYAKAKSYADPRRAYDYQGAEPDVFSVYVNLKNPLVVNAMGAIWRKFEIEIGGVKLFGTRRLVEYAQLKGFDGLIVKNVLDFYEENDKRKSSAAGDVICAFRREQIKLANGVNTTFDGNNPDIRYESGGDIVGRNLVLSHNKEKAPYMGSRFGQDVEPAGYYAIEKTNNFNTHLPNYETVTFEARKPLIVPVTNDTLVSWKYDLSGKYKAKGRKLSEKLMKEGYDVIITQYKEGDTGEIIVLDTSRIKPVQKT